MNIAIGDIHGRNCWEDINFDMYDNIYFLGDYFDSFSISFEDQFKNFKNITDFARKDKRVHLCIGNHDFQYLSGVSEWERYSGFQSKNYTAINTILQDNLGMLQFGYINGNYILTHAGVSKVWLMSSGLSLDTIDRWKNDYKNFYFNGIDFCGDDKTQSPIWIRPISLSKSKVEDYKQIIGHTPVKNVSTVGNLTLCDCLDYNIEFFEFE